MAQTGWQLLPEWHPQLGVLLAWPHAGTDWADHLEQAQHTYLCLIETICDVQQTWLIVPDEDTKALFSEAWQNHRKRTAKQTELPSNLSLIIAPYDDTWLRDSGPLTLGKVSSAPNTTTQADTNGIHDASNNDNNTINDSTLKLLSFRFNGWGNKFDHAQDAALATHLWTQSAFAHPQLDNAQFEALGIIAEGGNLETNGTGILLTQSHCLLHENRNSKLHRADWATLVKDKLGLDTIWWLDAGQIEGDDTDGHIDTLARFCSANHIVYQSCDETDYVHAESLTSMANQLQSWQQSPAYFVDGAPIQLTALPWPAPIYNAIGERLPATYANFLIINDHVLMPTYDVPQDALAKQVLSSCFPSHSVIGIPCRALIEQGGSLHCITMQISAPCG